ncbi:hypothetical protein LTR37_007852 [Vermiconidia calcicola]|uniref:Uncharacterized protein n=1 Tax=Vermiconidia calcicola TaxID=1690605 RepID=A0ACC3NDQ3_9PEZI|nr:hypothetical protein LTR37_007852 [Vermiconidia calcicola]
MSTPQLSKLVKVIHSNTGDFSSKLISLVDREPGSLLTPIAGSVRTDSRAYTSVQISESADIELNSDLVFANHSCSPSVIFDMENFEVRVVAHRALRAGEEVTFFYPSTEWEMQQPFECRCGSQKCLGLVRGAKFMDDDVLRRWWLNGHVERLLAARRKGGMESNGVPSTGVEINGI